MTSQLLSESAHSILLTSPHSSQSKFPLLFESWSQSAHADSSKPSPLMTSQTFLANQEEAVRTIASPYTTRVKSLQCHSCTLVHHSLTKWWGTIYFICKTVTKTFGSPRHQMSSTFSSGTEKKSCSSLQRQETIFIQKHCQLIKPTREQQSWTW